MRGDHCHGNNGMWRGKEMVGGVGEQGVEVGVDVMGGVGWLGRGSAARDPGVRVQRSARY